MEFLAEHFAMRAMNALDGVGAILGEHDRFADILPEVQFDIERMTGRIKIAAQVVPATTSMVRSVMLVVSRFGSIPV
ncbi:hypothetical protein AB4920_11165 [Bifidobacterium dentium]|uniref:hypothetical protein n=1 Tax=Bifidobacterium dentium TaxID=1689 RepID=UPI003D17CEF1